MNALPKPARIPFAKQSKVFLAGMGGAGAVGGLDAGAVTVFVVEFAQDRNTWSAKAMMTSLRAFLRSRRGGSRRCLTV